MLTRAVARQAFDLLPNPVLLVDVGGFVVDTNTAAAACFADPREHLVGARLDALFGGDAAALASRLARAFAGEPSTFRAITERAGDERRACVVRLAAASLDEVTFVLATLEDVTSHADAEEELRQSEQRYALLVKHLPRSVTMVFDRDLRFRLADGPEIGASGTSKEALEGKLLRDAVPPEFADTVEPLWRRVLAGESFSLVLPWEDRFYEYSYLPLRDASGEVVYGMVVGVNVTERKRAEEALRASEARLRAVNDHTPAFLAELDREGRIVFLNHAGQDGEAAEAVGQPLAHYVAEHDRPRVLDAIERALAGEVVALDYDGRPRPEGQRAFTSVFGPVSIDGVVERVAVSVLDVTQQRHDSVAAREAAQRLADVATELPGVLYQAKFSPATGMQVRFISDGVERIYGVTAAQCKADTGPLFAAIWPEDVPALEAAIGACYESLTPLKNVHRVKRADGKVVWLEASARARREPDGSIMLSGFTLDMTDRILVAEERERLIVELRARTAEMEQFVYTVSHDLKSPLVTIKGFLGFVAKDLASGNVARATEDLARVGSAADKMMLLLGDLLELSRVGRVAHHPTRVSLGDVARDAVDLVRGAADAARAEITIAPDLPEVFVDRGRIVQVLQNLIENAIKCRGERAPKIEIGSRPGGDEVVCFVRDDGIGVEPRHGERIFRLFEKLDPRSEGTGVGLALVRRIVEHHGGRVWVESEGLGKGATFLFSLGKVRAGDEGEGRHHEDVGTNDPVRGG